MKSILVIDTPKSCSECEFKRISQMGYETNCILTKIDVLGWTAKVDYTESRHPQCPLQDTTELLEALEEVKEVAEFYQRNINNSLMVNIGDKLLIKYNKLRTALGGE